MNALRFAAIRLWVWLLRLISTDKADPADLYFSYRLLLDREPDPAGWQHHLKFIAPGRSRRTLVESFLNSTEFQSARERSTFAPVETERFTIWVDTEDPLVAPGIMADREYETHVTAVLERELQSDSVFVDIGANMGWFTLLAAGIARQVIAIEPNPLNVQLLYHSLLTNRFDNVWVLPCAVSDRPALLSLNFLRSNGFVSAVGEASGATTIVQGQPLDALLKDVEQVDVIKMDIEGHEPIALRGMADTLARCRPVLVFEFHPAAIRDNTGSDPAAFLDSLSDLGYRLSVIHHDGAETPALDKTGIMAEWEDLNRRTGAGGSAHLDLIGRRIDKPRG